MSKNYKSIITICLLSGIILFSIATLRYPGGSNWNNNSVGFDWEYNYITHLFKPIAVNGESNGAVSWAIAAMAMLCVGFSFFFFKISQKISTPSSSRVIKWCGSLSMVFAFLAVTPWHDTAVVISNVLILLTLFYITVHLFKSRWYGFGLLSAICLATLYLGSFMYYGRLWIEWLPVVQKSIFIMAIVLALGLTWTQEKLYP